MSDGVRFRGVNRLGEDGRKARLEARLAAVLTIVLVAGSCARDPGTASGGSPASAPRPGTVIPADEGTPRDGGELQFGVDAEPDGLDPKASQFTVTGHLIASSIYESLAAFDANGNAQPFLASSIAPDAGAKLWTITVKPNITFQDGLPLDAKAVKANLDAAIAGIAGIALKPITSVDVVDDRTVTVTMSQPWASFTSILASQIGYMGSPATLGSPDAALHPVGTGPFTFDHWDRGTAVVVKKNPQYWQHGQPHVDGIKFRTITDPDSRASSLASGDLDMMSTDKPETIADYQTKPDYKVVVDQKGDTKGVVMNESAPPFDNINARRALVLATDSMAVTDAIGAGLLHPVDQPFADGSAYHQADAHYPTYDLDGAKRAVQQYTTETGQPLEFTLTTFADSTSSAMAQLLQAQWAQAGIKAEIQSTEQTEAVKAIIFGKTQASFEANFGFPDPDWNYIFWSSSFTAPAGQLSINFPHLKVDAIDQQVVAGRTDLDPRQRQDAYKGVARLLNENFTYVWLFRSVNALIAANRVHGLKQAEIDGFNSIDSKTWFGDLWLDR